MDIKSGKKEFRKQEEVKLNIRGIQNVEKYVSEQLKALRGVRIENVFLNEAGELVILYVRYERRFAAHYSVKQVSKKKYDYLSSWTNSSFKRQQNHVFFGTTKPEAKWVIDTKDIWLVFLVS